MSIRLSHPRSPRILFTLLTGACASAGALAQTTPPSAPAATGSPELEIGVQRVERDTQGVVGLSLEQEHTAFRLEADHSSRSQHLMLGGGVRLGDSHHLIGSLSTGREPIPGRTAKMKGFSGQWRLSGVAPVQGVRRWYVEGLHQRTQDRLLSVSDTPFDDTRSDTQGFTTTVTHTQGFVRRTERFYGGRRNELSATVEANAGEQGVVGLQWKQGRTRLLDAKDKYRRVHLNYRHYLPAQDAYLDIGVNNRGRWQFGGEIRIDRIDASLVLQAFRNTRDDKSQGIYLGLRFELGDVATHPGHKPGSNTELLRDTVRAMYAPRNYFGTVLQTKERFVTSETSTSHSNAPAAAPAPPVSPPPVPDPAPTDIQLQQTLVPSLQEVGPSAVYTWVSVAPQGAGRLLCSDIAVSPRTNNTCTFSGGNGLISVAPDGSLSFGPGTYGESSFDITVTATDQAGNTYTRTLTLAFHLQRP
ncbi:hypothetical protein [Hydrogenophaga sp. MI9]|uniref:hypothetical protein n=1 Tax=Hydrogenophaga sp. MI9 TaxID=3453719 RepID=UPI003EEE8573